ncbi:unnamed protein product [Peronospora destructor]|uniref:Uncharacterized protein n=1 Tax=Peronospora destructor TaxID=86335 RepID=A0AAV0UW71_9STRA|nr:unnamed protein product [Peronospora destructor]
MATRHDNRNRFPVRNALLKWQLQQDERRVAEVQHRLMRLATPSPSSSLEMNSRSFDRRLAARRPRPMHDKDRDEAVIRTVRMQRDERERDSDKHAVDRFKGSKCQKLVSPLRAKDGDNKVLCNAFVYGTKASRAKTNQLSEQLERYRPSGVFESFSQSRSHASSVYGDGEDRFTFPLNMDMGDDGMVPSELSTMSISEQTKQSIMQHSDIGSLATDANLVSAPTSGQSIAEMLASMEKSTEVEYGGDCGACNDQHCDVFSGGDRRQLSRDEFSAIDTLFARVEASSGMKFPWRSVIAIVCCLVIGTSGFFIEELITLVGLFSRRTQFLLLRAEQERIRDRMSVLQLELQNFQLLTSRIEVRSQTVLTELRQYMDRMRLDREKHQDILAKEMQKLRRHIFHVTHELVEQKRESLRTQLEEIIKVRVINIEGADDNGLVVKAADAENDEQLDEATTGTPIEVEPYLTMQESLYDSISASACEDNGGQMCLKRTKVEPSHELLTTGHVLVGVPSPLTTGELITVHQSEIKLESPILVHEVNAEHPVNIESASLPALEQSLNKIDDTVASTSQETANVMPLRNASGMSLDQMLLLVGIVFLAACVVLCAYNMNRRKRWYEERRTRRNRRALRLAQRRARAMAEYREDRDEWYSDETGGDIEEVFLMTPIRGNTDDESRPKLVHQSSDIVATVERHSHCKRHRPT